MTGAVATGALAGCSGEDSTSPGAADGEDPTGTTASPRTTTRSTEAQEATSTEAQEGTPQKQSVSFESPAGTEVHGTLFGSGTCGIVLVPQINLDRESWFPQAERLASRGLVALPVDEGDQRAAAVRGAISFLRDEHDVDRVVLLGASTGGEAVVVAGAEAADEVDGVITLSAAGGADHAADLSGTKLFVVSEDDEERFVRIAEQLHEQAPEPKQLLVLPGGAHGQRLFESDQQQRVREEIDTLLDQACSS